MEMRADVQVTNLNYHKSEKKKSVFEGGGPAASEEGISTLSPDKSSSLIFSPISVSACTNPAVSSIATCSPLAEHVQSVRPACPPAHVRRNVVPKLSPPRALSSEKLNGVADDNGSGESARASCESEGIGRETFGGKAQVLRAISPI